MLTELRDVCLSPWVLPAGLVIGICAGICAHPALSARCALMVTFCWMAEDQGSDLRRDFIKKCKVFHSSPRLPPAIAQKVYYCCFFFPTLIPHFVFRPDPDPWSI